MAVHFYRKVLTVFLFYLKYQLQNVMIVTPLIIDDYNFQGLLVVTMWCKHPLVLLSLQMWVQASSGKQIAIDVI